MNRGPATVERMSDEFVKFHLGDGRALHFFTGPDRGGPHDHPWPFVSQVLLGSYVERAYRPDGTSELIHRHRGDVFRVAATHIHEIAELPEGECLTLVQAGPVEREVRFWRFDVGQPQSRAWHEASLSNEMILEGEGDGRREV